MTLPLLLNLAQELDNLSTRMYDDDLGYTYPARRYNHHPALSLTTPQRYMVHRLQPRSESTVSHVGKDGFQVCLDVQQFKPSELTVKTVDNYVEVEGKHEEREDEHGLISRQFKRRYELPKGYDPNSVVSTLSSDGVLTIKAPLPAKSEASNERVVQIQQTGPAHLSVKVNNAASGSVKNGSKEE